MDEEAKKRKSYYEKNKQKIIEKAKEHYHRKKKEDPTYYETVLKRNNDSYHKNGRPDSCFRPQKPEDRLTEEQEEEYMRKIISHCQKVSLCEKNKSLNFFSL